MLTIQMVITNFKTNGKTRLYVDHRPTCVVPTKAQEYMILGSKEKVCRPVFYKSRTMTLTEQAYSKLKGEPLSVLTGIRMNRRYLYETKFEVVMDHQPLVSLHNVKKNLLVRVAKHRSKTAKEPTGKHALVLWNKNIIATFAF